MARLRGAAGFEELYQSRFKERWAGLRQALLAPTEHVQRPNGFAAHSPGLAAHYALDRASILAAESLSLGPGMQVLDMCAAPGGKALILAEQLFLSVVFGGGNTENDGIARRTLVLNELSRTRRARLARVLDDYVPPEIRQRIDVRGHNAARFGQHHPETYDAILLDAPCSSERHVLADPKALAEWSEARVQHLAIQQYALLRSAFAALKPGGVLVYATCALLEEENANVISRLHRKLGTEWKEEPLGFSLGHPERFGWSIWPDTEGAGPMYVCRLRKNAPT